MELGCTDLGPRKSRGPLSSRRPCSCCRRRALVKRTGSFDWTRSRVVADRTSVTFESDWLASRPVFCNDKNGTACHNINDVIDCRNLELDPQFARLLPAIQNVGASIRLQDSESANGVAHRHARAAAMDGMAST